MACSQREDEGVTMVKHITLNDLAKLMKKHDHFDKLEPNDL